MLLHSLALLAAARHTVLFHKPAGVVTTHADELGRPTVYDALRAALPAPLSALAWHACGRLDQNTSGLLVLTTDGGLVHHVTHPSASSPRARGGGGATVEKEYRALCMGALGDDALDRLRAGVELGGGLGSSRPARVRVEAREPRAGPPRNTWLRVVIDEGKNRQVRRMLHAVGSGVLRLERVRVGGLTLRGLEEPGAWRRLDDSEVRSELGYAPPAPERASPRPRRARAKSRRRTM